MGRSTQAWLFLGGYMKSPNGMGSGGAMRGRWVELEATATHRSPPGWLLPPGPDSERSSHGKTDPTPSTSGFAWIHARAPLVQDHEADTDEKKPKYDLNIGSSWVPGISDGSHLMPDSARVRIEQDTDGVWRPARMA